MRIALVTQEEPFYLPPALDAFCRARRSEILALIVLPAFNERLVDTAGRLYEFYGPFDFTRLMARFASHNLADRANRVRPIFPPRSARDVGRRHNIPLYFPDSVNSPEFVRVIQSEIRPDLVVSIAASQIFRREILSIPPLGCINLHSAPLPRYQGMMPNFWSMVHGEREAAVTVHYMVEKLDVGDILVQLPVPIHPTDSLHALMVRSKHIGVQALLAAISQIEQGATQLRPMDESRATYFSFPKRDDALRLRRMGHRLL